MSDGYLIGAVIMWGGTADNLPAGWLLCDGTIYDRTAYPDLAKAIDLNFGGGGVSYFDPDTQFFVPDLRGRFVRGVDSPDVNRDPDRDKRLDMQSGTVVGGKVGSIQADQFKAHTHNYSKFPYTLGNIASGPAFPFEDQWSPGVIETDPNEGAETRPINVYLCFIIKAFEPSTIPKHKTSLKKK